MRAGAALRALHVSCVATLIASRAQAQHPSVGDIPSRVDRIFARFDRATPGCGVGLAKDGRTLYTHGYGSANLEYAVPNTDSTVFESGSVAKQFTAAAIVLLAQDGKLSLDDDIRKYLPEVPSFGGQRIAIRNLLTHTSGLRDYLDVGFLASGMTIKPKGVALATRSVPDQHPDRYPLVVLNTGLIISTVITGEHYVIDVLAAVPHLLGFHPARSLVVIGAGGPRGRIRLGFRYDLPDPPAAGAARRIADHAVAVLAERRASTVIAAGCAN
jgi:hypothetical protein